MMFFFSLFQEPELVEIKVAKRQSYPQRKWGDEHNKFVMGQFFFVGILGFPKMNLIAISGATFNLRLLISRRPLGKLQN